MTRGSITSLLTLQQIRADVGQSEKAYRLFCVRAVMLPCCLCGVYYPWRIQHICQVNLGGELFSRDIKLTGQTIRLI